MAASLVALSACASPEPSASKNQIPTKTPDQDQAMALSYLTDSTVEIITGGPTYCTGNVISLPETDQPMTQKDIQIIDVLTADHCAPPPCTNYIDCDLKLDVNKSYLPEKNGSINFMAYASTSHQNKDLALISLVVKAEQDYGLKPLAFSDSQQPKPIEGQELYALPLGRFQHGIRKNKSLLSGSDPDFLTFGKIAIATDNQQRKDCDRDNKILSTSFFKQHQFIFGKDMFYFFKGPESPYLLNGGSGAAMIDAESGKIFGVATHASSYLLKNNTTGRDDLEVCDLAFVPDGIDQLAQTNREKIIALLKGSK
jgi:hypothetical protein